MLSYNELESKIQEDCNYTTGKREKFPVRIIHFSSIDDYRLYINSFEYKKVDLLDFLENNNSWIGVNNLIEIVFNNTETCTIFPISEIIRFYTKNEFITFLNEVLLFQNTHDNNLRIYIPIVGLYNELNTFYESYNRKDEYEHVWFVYSTEEVPIKKKVFYCPEEINSKLATINNTREWLAVWKDFNNNFYLIKSLSLLRRWENLSTNNYLVKREISNYKDLFEQAYDLDFKISFVSHEIEYWATLCELYENNKDYLNLNISQIINKILVIQNYNVISEENLLTIYLSKKTFERWLLKVFSFQLDLYDNYMWYILSKNEDFTDYELLKNLYYRILEVQTIDCINVRKKLIESLPCKLKNPVNIFIDDFFDKIKDIISKNIDILTNFSLKEKVLKFNISFTNNDLETLYSNIPLFREYSGWDINPLITKNIPENIINYFTEYNITKIRNQKCDRFNTIFCAFNGNSEKFYKWYFSLNTLNKYKDKQIIQIDGLGVEWIPYIIYLFGEKTSHNGLIIEDVDVVRAELPSITKFNKITNDINFIRDYDNQIIHKQQGYNYPESIFEEFEMISEIFEKNIFNTPYSDFYITADHGASCLCQKQFEAVSLQKSSTSEHEGRYCLSDKHFLDNEYFIKYQDYKIALKHSSLNSISHREVHGGATPEEVMIPVFHITRKINRDANIFSIQLENNIITHSRKELEISISSIPSSLPILKINGNSIEGCKKGDLFSFDIHNIKKGTYSIIIIVDNYRFNSEITIATGMIEEDLFDE